MSPKAKSAAAIVSDAARRSLSRLERILLLVPYCVAHPGVSIAELAKRFGAPEKEILDDLNLLFVCGLPDYTPADLIEVFIDEDQVFIRMADYFARPLRLTRTEAIPLYLKAQALVNLLQGTGRRPVGLEGARLAAVGAREARARRCCRRRAASPSSRSGSRCSSRAGKRSGSSCSAKPSPSAGASTSSTTRTRATT